MTAALTTIGVLIGAVGLYLLMPGARLSSWKAATPLLLAACALAIGSSLQAFPAIYDKVAFSVFAAIGLLGGICVITNKQPVYSALFFVLVVVCVTGLLLLMQAQFLSMALLAIYAGAILVTYVFVIMLAQQGGTAAYDHTARSPLIGVLAGFVLLGIISAGLGRPEGGPPQIAMPSLAADAGAGTVRNVGLQLLTTYAVAIQIAGVLLLASMVGAVGIARRKASTGGIEEVD
ncbi:MAG: NADH-quinone oxidoreductase subunit J [Phycisphaerae bacterium]|nr:NADH-quinone oxidoreductase subunit J [Phycisphaerae bacterium]